MPGFVTISGSQRLMFDPKIDIPRLERGNCHIWSISVNRESHRDTELTTVLNQEELQKANRYRFEADRQTYITARYSLRTLLGKYTDCEPEGLIFHYGKHGKPSLPDSGLEFNVSHSGDRVVLAVTEAGPVGIDIERIKPHELFPDDEVLQVGRHFFASEEYKRLYALPQEHRRKAFFECWTRKEAFIKAEGSGLSFPLDQFEVAFGDNNAFQLLDTSWDKEEPQRWSVFGFQREDYVGAVAARGDVTHWVKMELQWPGHEK